MQPTPELIDELYRDRVLRARQMSPEEKLLAGPQLYDDVCGGKDRDDVRDVIAVQGDRIDWDRRSRRKSCDS